MTATLEQTGFTQEAFDDFLTARNDPGWLADIRRAAWQQFSELPMPSGKDEEWMRTDIRLFKLDRYSLPGERNEQTSRPTALLSQGVDLGGQTQAVDSRTVESALSNELASKGILYGSLGQLANEHGDLLKPFFERRLVNPGYDKFAALNAACWSGGTLLYVPKGVRVEQPLHSLATITDGGVDLSRTLVILEEGAEATMLAETSSIEQSDGGMHCGTIELIVGERAHLRYVNLQNWGDKVWHFAHQMGEVAANASLQWTIGALGSRLAKVNQHVALAGQDAQAQ
ncbi:MAG: SufD family Fe-S cluster assembly protein, partial [Lacipirellulaceae bacterium]